MSVDELILKQRLVEAEESRDAWRGAAARAAAMAKVLAEALEEAMNKEGIWYGDPEIIKAIMIDLGVGNYDQ